MLGFVPQPNLHILFIKHNQAALGKLQFSRWMRFILELDTETHDWAVWCPELPGCVSVATTEQDALNNISEAIALYLQPDTNDVEKVRPHPRSPEVQRGG